jgi:hypothetical protein
MPSLSMLTQKWKVSINVDRDNVFLVQCALNFVTCLFHLSVCCRQFSMWFMWIFLFPLIGCTVFNCMSNLFYYSSFQQQCPKHRKLNKYWLLHSHTYFLYFSYVQISRNMCILKNKLYWSNLLKKTMSDYLLS